MPKNNTTFGKKGTFLSGITKGISYADFFWIIPCLILVDIPSSLILSVKNRGRQGFLLNSQNLLSMTNVIC